MVTIDRPLGNKAFNLITKIKLILDFIVLFLGARLGVLMGKSLIHLVLHTNLRLYKGHLVELALANKAAFIFIDP